MPQEPKPLSNRPVLGRKVKELDALVQERIRYLSEKYRGGAPQKQPTDDPNAKYDYYGYRSPYRQRLDDAADRGIVTAQMLNDGLKVGMQLYHRRQATFKKKSKDKDEDE